LIKIVHKPNLIYYSHEKKQILTPHENLFF